MIGDGSDHQGILTRPFGMWSGLVPWRLAAVSLVVSFLIGYTHSRAKQAPPIQGRCVGQYGC